MLTTATLVKVIQPSCQLQALVRIKLRLGPRLLQPLCRKEALVAVGRVVVKNLLVLMNYFLYLALREKQQKAQVNKKKILAIQIKAIQKVKFLANYCLLLLL